MRIIFSSTEDKKAVINAVNSQMSVKDHLNEEFKLHDILIYGETSEDGSEDIVSCFFIETADGNRAVISSISSVVYSGAVAAIAVMTDENGVVNMEDMGLIFRSRKTNQGRECIYFEVL